MKFKVTKKELLKKASKGLKFEDNAFVENFPDEIILEGEPIEENCVVFQTNTQEPLIKSMKDKVKNHDFVPFHPDNDSLWDSCEVCGYYKYAHNQKSQKKIRKIHLDWENSPEDEYYLLGAKLNELTDAINKINKV